MRFFFLISFAFLVTACSGGGAPVQQNSGPGSIITGKSEQGISLSDLVSGGGNAGGALPINALLWRASLDIISTIPLDDIDTFGGSIVTEWYSLSDRPEERIKVALFVVSRELRSDGIKATVYVQRRNGDKWEDAGIDQTLGQQLEELILTRAREIRSSSLSEE